MNHSLYSADRSTHVRIVSVALVAAILVTGFGIYSHWDADVGQQAASAMANALQTGSLPTSLPSALPIAVTLTPDAMW